MTKQEMINEDSTIKCAFDFFTFIPLYEVLEKYQKHVSNLIKEEEAKDLNVDRLKDIKEDIRICLLALIENGRWTK